jgi:hypothetical protein
MLELNDKVNIILTLFIFTICFHILFFIKPDWFNFSFTCSCCKRRNCPCIRGGGCPCMRNFNDDDDDDD